MSPKNSRQPQFITSHRSHYFDKTHLCRIFAPPCSRERLSPGPLTVDSSSACLWGAATAATPLTFTKSQPTDLVSASTHVQVLSCCFLPAIASSPYDYCHQLRRPCRGQLSTPSTPYVAYAAAFLVQSRGPESRPFEQYLAFDFFLAKLNPSACYLHSFLNPEPRLGTWFCQSLPRSSHEPQIVARAFQPHPIVSTLHFVTSSAKEPFFADPNVLPASNVPFPTHPPRTFVLLASLRDS